MAQRSFRDLFDEARRHPGYWAELNMLQFSEAILAEMDRQGVTRAELARRLETSQAHVTRLLNGTSNLTLTTMTRMAFALGLRVETTLVCLPAGTEEARRKSLDAAQ